MEDTKTEEDEDGIEDRGRDDHDDHKGTIDNDEVHGLADHEQDDRQDHEGGYLFGNAGDR